MTPQGARPLVSACLLGSLSLLLSDWFMASLTAQDALSEALRTSISADLAAYEIGMLYVDGQFGALQLRQVELSSLVLCGAVAWFSAGAWTLRPWRTLALGLTTLAACTVEAPVLLARLAAAAFSVPWLAEPFPNLSKALSGGHLVQPVYPPDNLVIPFLDTLPYLMPVPALTLAAVSAGAIGRSWRTRFARTDIHQASRIGGRRLSGASAQARRRD